VINSNEVVDGNGDAWAELRRRSRADLTLLRSDLHVSHTIIGGEVLFSA
jgi:N-acetylglucosamine-6-phosphate deacetylase